MNAGRRTTFAVAALVLSVVGGVLVLEGAVRVLGVGPRPELQYSGYVTDPFLPYKPQPGSTLAGRSSTGEFDYEYTHNSLGFRDVEHDAEKSPEVVRVLGLGDSFTYGVGAAFEETFLYRLEARLNDHPRRARRVEIIKAGLPRFFPESERMLLEGYGARLAPDVVLVHFVPNDVIDTFTGLEAVVVDASGYLKSREGAQLGALGTWMYEWSHLGRLVLKNVSDRRSRRGPQPQWPDVYRGGGFHEGDWQTIEREFGRMVDAAGDLGAAIVFVHIPQAGPWEAHHGYPAVRLSRWAADHGAGFIDVLPAMRAAAADTSMPSLSYPKDGHCTPWGYGVVADAIFDGLVDDPATAALLLKPPATAGR